MEGYGERWRILLRLGFATYADYLQSDLWQDIRKRVLALRSDRRCDNCEKERAVQVHHRTYDEKTLRGLRLDRLVPLCRKCHEQIEFDAMGRKRTLAETARQARELAAELAPLWLRDQAAASAVAERHRSEAV